MLFHRAGVCSSASSGCQPVRAFTVRLRAGLMQEAMFRLAVSATLRQTLASGRLCFLEDEKIGDKWTGLFSSVFHLEDLIRKGALAFWFQFE